MSEKAEELSLEFASIVDASVTNVADLELAKRVGDAQQLLERLQEVFAEYKQAAAEEIQRQAAARHAALESVGLTAGAASSGGKRGRKPKSEAPAKAVVEAAEPVELLDAE